MTATADDLDALFDEISAQRTEAIITPATVAKPQPQSVAVSHAPQESQTDKPMFDRLGGIVRMLHDSMRELGYDRALNDVASQITDAQDRLEYVATLTEQAANKVLNATEAGMPEQETLSKNAKEMDARWGLLFDGQLGIAEFKLLATDSRQFAAAVVDATEAEKARLLEIMMAQDFQDLTGQLIKKVVAITQMVEKELAQLLRDHAPAAVKDKPAAAKEVPVDLLQGPSAPTAAMAQDDVDNLLDDLGF